MRSSSSSLSSHQDALLNNNNNNFPNTDGSDSEENGSPQISAKTLSRAKSVKSTSSLSKTSALMVQNFVSQGKIHLDMQRFNDAASCFAAALFIDPDNTHLYALRSVALFGAGLYGQALNDCDLALSREGKEGEGKEQQALSREEKEGERKEQHVDAGTSVYELQLRQADCLLRLGQLPEAEYGFKALQRGYGEEGLNDRLKSIQKVKTIVKLGPFLWSQKRFQELLKHVTEGLAISPYHDDLIVLQCRSFLALKDNGE